MWLQTNNNHVRLNWSDGIVDTDTMYWCRSATDKAEQRCEAGQLGESDAAYSDTLDLTSDVSTNNVSTSDACTRDASTRASIAAFWDEVWRWY